MKIIDWEKKGNVVRFFLGNDDLVEWYGDDWDDTPYEHNAGRVYENFVASHIDIAYGFDKNVAEPSDDWRYCNSPYCKDDFKNGKAPCIVITDSKNYWGSDEFSIMLGDKNATKIYLGDDVSVLTENDCGVVLHDPLHSDSNDYEF